MSTAPTRQERVIRKEVVLPHPPEVVWAALTNGEALAQWLMPNDFQPVIGRPFRFHVDPMPLLPGHIVQCEVLELRPPTRMVWSWNMVATKPGKGLPPQVIEWDLSPEGTGTRLRFTQRGYERIGLVYRLMMSHGWNTMLKRWLPRVLEAFEREGADGWRYRRLEKAPNRGHHGVKTVPEGYFR